MRPIVKFGENKKTGGSRESPANVDGVEAAAYGQKG